MKTKELRSWKQKIEAWISALSFLDSKILPPSLLSELPSLKIDSPEMLKWVEMNASLNEGLCELSMMAHRERDSRWSFWVHFENFLKGFAGADHVQIFHRFGDQGKWVRLQPLGNDELEDVPEIQEEQSTCSPVVGFQQQHLVVTNRADRDILGFLFLKKVPFPKIRIERADFFGACWAQWTCLVDPFLKPASLPEDSSVKPKTQLDQQGIIGEDPKFVQALQQVEKAASSDATVYLHGESGTGKELFAKFLHQKSRRNKGPFLAINCSAIPSELIESEMFGHEKGAFTGAYYRKIGRVEQANGGTLFLDEIGEMPLSFQAKLLRYLQEKTFSRVGGNQVIHSDARIVVATHRDLKQLVATKQFREDLYYRIHVIPVVIPPLKERVKDIRILSEHFFHKFISKSRASRRTVDPVVFDFLERYPWPGNVRELENVIQRTVVMAKGDTIEIKDLPDELRKFSLKPAPPNYRLHPFEYYDSVVPTSRDELNDLKKEVEHLGQTYSRDLERRFLIQLLAQADNSPRKAAELADINRTLFYKLLKRAGVDVGILGKEDA